MPSETLQPETGIKKALPVVKKAQSDLYGFTWITMDLHGFTWIDMDLHGLLWIYMDLHGFTWIYVYTYLAKSSFLDHQCA